MSFSNPVLVKNKQQKYHPELIALFNKDVQISATIGNIIGSTIFAYAMKSYIPLSILLPWLLFSILIGVSRILLAKKYTNQSDTISYINTTSLITALSGLLWGGFSAVIFVYAPTQYLFFTTIVILGMVGGANTTLTPIYKAYLYYAISAVLPLIVVLLMEGEKVFTFTAFLAMLFLLFVLLGGYKHNTKLHEAIILKDKLKVLNEGLEGEVKKRTEELESLNNSLEDKVKDEIAKNRDKDQQILQQSRMAQMGEMISMIAHQWRQPLGAIASSSIDLKMKMAFSSFDLNTHEGQDDCNAYFDKQLTHIEEYVQGLTNTIDDFRNFYKPNKEKKNISIHEPIKKSLSIIEAAAKANGVELHTHFQSQKILSVHDSELMQVFLNIIKNAQDNFKDKEIKNPNIHIHTFDTKEGVHVDICDNGGGIPNDIMMKVFDPYFSTKDEKNGTGLGLYMSKTIIEEHHNGILSAINKDNGVCFTIIIKDVYDENI